MAKIVYLSIAFVALFSCANSLFFTLEETEKCFYHKVTSFKNIQLSYAISGRGEKNVEATFKGPNDDVEFQNRNKRDADVLLVPKILGTHELCFKRLDRQNKVIAFDVSSEDDITSGNLAEQKHVDEVEKQIHELYRNLEHVYKNLSNQQKREEVHRDLSESTNDRVKWCSLLNLVVILTVSLTQIYLLKGYFDVDSSYKYSPSAGGRAFI